MLPQHIIGKKSQRCIIQKTFHSNDMPCNIRQKVSQPAFEQATNRTWVVLTKMHARILGVLVPNLGSQGDWLHNYQLTLCGEISDKTVLDRKLLPTVTDQGVTGQ